MPYLGSYAVGDYVTFTANTHNNKGQSRDADSLPTYRIYKDNNGTPITNGTMALLDDANTTGFYSYQVRLTGSFVAGSIYTIFVAATVQNTDGTISHQFQIPTPSASEVSLVTGAYANITNDVWSELQAGYASLTGSFGYYLDRQVSLGSTGTVAGGTDWDATERSHIRYRLGIDGASAAPAATPTLAIEANVEGHVTTALTAFDPATVADLSAAESNIRGADSDDLKTLSDQLDTAQADLDNPDQYKADVSALAVEANVEGHVTTALTSFDPATASDLTTTENNIRGVDSDTLKTLSD